MVELKNDFGVTVHFEILSCGLPNISVSGDYFEISKELCNMSYEDYHMYVDRLENEISNESQRLMNDKDHPLKAEPFLDFMVKWVRGNLTFEYDFSSND